MTEFQLIKDLGNRKIVSKFLDRSRYIFQQHIYSYIFIFENGSKLLLLENKPQKVKPNKIFFAGANILKMVPFLSMK